MSKTKRDRGTKKNILDVNSDRILLAGRIKCECMASLHNLINNCIQCGRIVCEQEGEGSCFFCGNPVYSQNNPLVNELSSNQFVSLSEGNPGEIDVVKERAINHRDKLLNYEKNMNPQSNIIDDETDWYDVADNVWLSNQQRDFAVAKIKEEEFKKEDHNKGIGITFDIESKTFVSDEKAYDDSKAKKQAQTFITDATKTNTNKSIDSRLPEEFEKIHQEMTAKLKAEINSIIINKNTDPIAQGPPKKKFERVQHDDIFDEFKNAVEQQTRIDEQANSSKGEDLHDEEIFDLQITDTGSCLSMHQPWASLLVLGFKRFEGRQWTTKYRGPLWIQAGSKVPTQEEIKMVEAQYLDLYKDAPDMPPFPDRYPLSSLLGVVDLEDVVRSDIYQKAIPEEQREESGCKFLFVIRNPRRLLYPIKFSGQRQIFKIEDENVLNAAKKNLLKVRTNWFPYHANKLREYAEDSAPADDKQASSGPRRPALKYEFKSEKGGLFVENVIPQDMLATLLETFRLELDRKHKGKAVGRAKALTLELNDSMEAFKRINDMVVGVVEEAFGEKESREVKKVDVCIISEKEKPFNLGDKYLGVLFFGKGMKIALEDNKNFIRRETTLTNNTMCIRDFTDNIDMSFVEIERVPAPSKNDVPAKIVQQQLENHHMLIFFY